MNFSIIIPTFNSAKTIQKNLDSIILQTFENYQVVVIDNSSTDETINIIKKNEIKNIKFLIEKDDGIFDAINKGIKISDNEYISVLHSDDFYNDKDVLQNVFNAFEEDTSNDIVYGNLIYVKKDNINSNIRYWKPGPFRKDSFFKGWHPPHPSFFVKKKLFKKFGYYDHKIGNSADVELMYRYMEINGINSKYINKTLVKMRYGGASNKNFLSIYKQNIQILRSLKINKNFFKIIIFFVYKFFDRLKQFVIT
mgnify:CR=1 FL=1